MKKKKSYNPFKMWGSYVGLIAFIGIFILLSNQDSFTSEHEYLCLKNIHGFDLDGNDVISKTNCLLDFENNADALGIETSWFLTFLYFPILGFLIGYGIHSIYRKYF